jgi:opacity protein-like surface antigen
VTLPIQNVVFATQAGYADGALGYITTDPGAIGDFGGPSAEDTNQAWNVRAGLLAPLTERVSAWLDGSYTHAEDDANDESYDFWAFVLGASYAPTASLMMGPEVAYNNMNGDDPGEDGDIWGVMWRIESSF